MQPSKGSWSNMASHLFKQFTYIFVLLSFINLALAGSEVSEQVFYKQGDEFTLKAYEESPSVYARIDAVLDHPFLNKYYFISFHGVCFGNHQLMKGNSLSQGVAVMSLSHDALLNSISTLSIDKKNSMVCEGYHDFNLDAQHEMVMRGGRGVLMDPIHDIESVEFMALQYMSIIHN